MTKNKIVKCPLCKYPVTVYYWSWHNGKKCPNCTVIFFQENCRDEINPKAFQSIQDLYKYREIELPTIRKIFPSELSDTVDEDELREMERERKYDYIQQSIETDSGNTT